MSKRAETEAAGHTAEEIRYPTARRRRARASEAERIATASHAVAGDSDSLPTERATATDRTRTRLFFPPLSVLYLARSHAGSHQPTGPPPPDPRGRNGGARARAGGGLLRHLVSRGLNSESEVQSGEMR